MLTRTAVGSPPPLPPPAAVILVASGIGITPALSIINAHKATRRINLIWACRDPSLLEFYLENNEFDPHAWTLIFYTGKRQLAVNTRQLPKTVLVLSGRPQFEKVICELISGIEEGSGLPEAVVHEAAAHLEAMRQLNMRLQGLHNNVDEPGAPLLRFVLLLTHALYLLEPADLRALSGRKNEGRGGDRGGGGGDDSLISLAELTAIVTDAMPDLYHTEDVSSLSEALGGPLKFDRLRVPSHKLRDGDVEGFGHDLLRQLQRAAGTASVKAPSDEMSMRSVSRSTVTFDPLDMARQESFIARKSLAGAREAVQLQLHEMDDVIEEEEEEGEEGEEGGEERGAAPAAAADECDDGAALLSRSSSAGGARPNMRAETAAASRRKTRANQRTRGLSAQYLTSSRLRSLQSVSSAAREESSRCSAFSWWLNETSEISRSQTMLTRAKSAFIDIPIDKDARPAPPAEPHRLRTWQMLYCGGAQPVVDALREISKRYGIKLRVEKFDW